MLSGILLNPPSAAGLQMEEEKGGRIAIWISLEEEEEEGGRNSPLVQQMLKTPFFVPLSFLSFLSPLFLGWGWWWSGDGGLWMIFSLFLLQCVMGQGRLEYSTVNWKHFLEATGLLPNRQRWLELSQMFIKVLLLVGYALFLISVTFCLLY